MSAHGPDPWWESLAVMVEGGHTASDATELADLLARAVRPVGLTVRAFLVDRPQRVLTRLDTADRAPDDVVEVDGTPGGEAFQLLRIAVAEDGDALWVPVVDGADRLGVLRLGLPAGADPHDEGLHQRCRVFAGLVGHVLATKFPFSDTLQRVRRTAGMHPAAELLWQLLPPQTITTPAAVVSAVVEPYDRVGGDAYDYSVDHDAVFVALFDAVGHDMQSGLTAAVALAAVRSARRGGERDLVELARAADRAIAANRGAGYRFASAALARLDTRTGRLSYLLAGHPPPLRLRPGAVATMDHTPRPPLGVLGGPDVPAAVEQ
ncbi:MAG: Serine phosphatase RsbU, regulator of sigma subunit, partial [uncultured Pseudonocardia sp.]